MKITIENNGEIAVIETEYMLLMTGKKEEGKLHTQLNVENLTYGETTRCNSFLGFMLVNRINELNKEEKENEK